MGHLKVASNIIQVFIPEVIPLENKGEEAILRGLEDVLFPGQKVHFHILAYNCNKPETMGNLTIYPDKWFYPCWVFREVYLSFNPLDVLNMMGFLFQGVRNRLPFLASKAHLAVWLNERLMHSSSIFARIWKMRAAALKTLSKVDFVLAGHDEAMGLREAHLLKGLAKIGLEFGIFGCGMNSRWSNAAVAEVYRTTFHLSKFLYFRDHETWKGIHGREGIAAAQLAPDPAFGMCAAEESVVEEFIKKEGLTSLFSKQVVAITVVENAVIMKSFKSHKSTRQKAKAHYRLIGNFVDHLAKNWGVNVLFLPHCIGPTPRLDDRRVARNVLRYSKVDPGAVRILETPCNARLLKGLIKRSSFLIGERTHSLIGAVSVGTPFICLGSLSDKRTREIIGKMCHASDLVYDLQEARLEDLIRFADNIWKERNAVKQRMKQIGVGIRHDLEEAAQVARTRMSGHLQKNHTEPCL
ncbi:MAG: polysaccharide pyruvyl transferase family protein [Deltaproteobacteria bacterium]